MAQDIFTRLREHREQEQRKEAQRIADASQKVPVAVHFEGGKYILKGVMYFLPFQRDEYSGVVDRRGLEIAINEDTHVPPDDLLSRGLGSDPNLKARIFSEDGRKWEADLLFRSSNVSLLPVTGPRERYRVQATLVSTGPVDGEWPEH